MLWCETNYHTLIDNRCVECKLTFEELTDKIDALLALPRRSVMMPLRESL